jgi:hypothetical protein
VLGAGKIAENKLTAQDVNATIEQNYGIMVGPVTSYGQVVAVVATTGLMKEARKTIVSGK